MRWEGYHWMKTKKSKAYDEDFGPDPEPGGDERASAWRYFGIDKWPIIRWAALKLLMWESQKKREYWDEKLIERVSKRFRVGSAFSFYSRNQHLWF